MGAGWSALAQMGPPWESWGWHWTWMWGAMGIGMLLWMILFWGLLVAGVVVLVRWVWGTGRPGPPGGAAETALDILKKRYAKGEITKEQFETMRRDIQ